MYFILLFLFIDIDLFDYQSDSVLVCQFLHNQEQK